LVALVELFELGVALDQPVDFRLRLPFKHGIHPAQIQTPRPSRHGASTGGHRPAGTREPSSAHPRRRRLCRRLEGVAGWARSWHPVWLVRVAGGGSAGHPDDSTLLHPQGVGKDPRGTGGRAAVTVRAAACRCSARAPPETTRRSHEPPQLVDLTQNYGPSARRARGVAGFEAAQQLLFLALEFLGALACGPEPGSL